MGCHVTLFKLPKDEFNLFVFRVVFGAVNSPPANLKKIFTLNKAYSQQSNLGAYLRLNSHRNVFSTCNTAKYVPRFDVASGADATSLFEA